MIVAEGALIGLWLIVLHSIYLFVKVMARGSWLSTTLGVLSI